MVDRSSGYIYSAHLLGILAGFRYSRYIPATPCYRHFEFDLMWGTVSPQTNKYDPLCLGTYHRYSTLVIQIQNGFFFFFRAGIFFMQLQFPTYFPVISSAAALRQNCRVFPWRHCSCRVPNRPPLPCVIIFLISRMSRISVRRLGFVPYARTTWSTGLDSISLTQMHAE